MNASIYCPRGFNFVVICFSLFLFLGLLLFALENPDEFTRQLAKDHSPGGAGLFEHLTVVVLVPGILSGLYTFWNYRDRLPSPYLGYWVMAWSLACIYFAGEEASWGQWYLGWETPDVLLKYNDQKETNLHNMSSWLDQMPRLLVELFVFTAGFLVPLRRIIHNQRPIMRRNSASIFDDWIFAPTALLSVGALFVATKIAKWIPNHALKNLGNGELREFIIAWFLMCYLLSYAVRLRRLERPEGGLKLAKVLGVVPNQHAEKQR